MNPASATLKSIFLAKSTTKDVYRFSPEGTIYSGARNQRGLPHGHGCMLYKLSDCVYVGSWKDGKRDGLGAMTWGNQDCYDGAWENDEMSGVGIFTKGADKSSYSGSWKGGVPDGRGIIKHSSGKRYEGNWSNGKMDGEGVFVFDGGIMYDGSWKAGEMVDAAKLSLVQEATRKSSGGLSTSAFPVEEIGRRSSHKFRSSLFLITDFQHSYQIYPTNFKDYVVFSTILFFVGLGTYLICV